jgi:hypothetical protein
MISDSLKIVKAGAASDRADHGEIAVQTQFVSDKISHPFVCGSASAIIALELFLAVEYRLHHGRNVCDRVEMDGFLCFVVDPWYSNQGLQGEICGYLQLLLVIRLFFIFQLVL